MKTEMSILDFFIGIISDWCGSEAELSANEVDYEGDVDNADDRDMDDDGVQDFSRHHISSWSNKLRHIRLKGQHFPIRFERTKTTEDEKGIDGRGPCKLCHKKTMFKCDRCNIWLCIQSNTKETCWKHFHSDENLDP